jgi:hypothetical protein
MVDLKRFHFAYDRPSVLPRWADRETVFNLGRSFFGCIMWSKQDAFQIQIRRSCQRLSHMVFAAGSAAPLPAPHELNLGRNLQLFFSEVSLYPIQYSPA